MSSNTINGGNLAYSNDVTVGKSTANVANKIIECYRIVKDTLIVAGFLEEQITEQVVVGYNILSERDLLALRAVCLNKCGQSDILSLGLIDQKIAQLNKERLIILQLTKKALHAGVHAGIKKYKYSILLIIAGFMSLIVILSKNGAKGERDSKPPHTIGSRDFNHLS